MKSILPVLALAAACFFTEATMAQSQQRIGKLKERMKTELNIDEVKADTVINIIQRNFMHARAVKSGSLTDEQKKTAIKTARKEEMAHLRTYLDQSQLQKLQQLIQEFRAERQTKQSASDADSDE